MGVTICTRYSLDLGARPVEAPHVETVGEGSIVGSAVRKQVAQKVR